MDIKDLLNSIKTENDVKGEFLMKAEEFVEEMSTHTSSENENTIIVLATNGEGAIVAASGKTASMAALIDEFENKNPQIKQARAMKALKDLIGKMTGISDSE